MSGFGPDRVSLIQGSWPSEENAHAPIGTPLDVALDSLGFELLGLQLGEVMDVFPAASFTDPPSMRVRISGVFERVDPDDEFWYETGSDFSLSNDRWTIIPLFTSEEAIVQRVITEYPTLYTDMTWYYFLDREGLRSDDVDHLKNTIYQAESDIRFGLKNSSFSIRLDDLLENYDLQLLLARVPLFLVVFLIVGILLYYLSLVAGLIVRSRSIEISMLKSRGATTFQVGLLGLGEGLLLGIPAVIIGPFLAIGIVKVLGQVFFSIGGGAGELSGVPIIASQEAILLGLIGGAMAVTVFTIATLVAARHGIVEARQAGARPPTDSILHRYYLDILILALIGLLWWQIQSRGTFLVQSAGGRQLEIDYSLLLGPVLGLFAVGLVIMRVFPLLIRILSWLIVPFAPSWLAHSLRQVSRDPMVPGILIVLLTLSTALGVIGSAFSSTLERSQKEQSLYAAGADLRVRHSGISSSIPGGRFADRVKGLPHVVDAADVHRANAQITATGFSSPASVLAVDAKSMSEVAWYRDDLADGKSMEEITGLLLGGWEAPPGILLPEDATGLSIWVQPAGVDSGANLWARVRDSRGLFFDTWMGNLGAPGWNKIQSDLSPVIAAGRRSQISEREIEIVPPLSLQSFQITDRIRSLGSSGLGSIFLGRLEALTPSGPVTIADLTRADDWSAIEDFSRPGLYAVESSNSAAIESVQTSMRFSWASGGVGMRGVRPGPMEAPIPALVSDGFLETADASVGDDVILGLSTYSIMVKIIGVINYFPTMDPNVKPFAVVNLESFEAATNQHSPIPLVGANEIWIDLMASPAPGENGLSPLIERTGDVEAVVDSMKRLGVNVREIYDAGLMVESKVDQPLVNAGWGALLVLLFLALALASGSGVILFSFLDMKDRQTEFALFSTLGSTSGQLRRIVWFNLFLIVICGVSLGTWVGHIIGSSILPLMEVAEAGERVMPPMAFSTDWLALGVTYLVLALVTLGTVLWLAWLNSKIQVQQVLRMGDAG